MGTTACLCLAFVSASIAAGQPAEDDAGAITIRVATFNLGDVRGEEIADPGSVRLNRLAGIIQRLRPNILLLNEIACDLPGASGDAGCLNAQRFAGTFLATARVPGLEPLKYRAFMAPVNTGVPSGFDLDGDGTVWAQYPVPGRANADGTHPEPSGAGRLYGNDCWGFGTFPGQYGMALLVDERITVMTEHVRTFRLLPWDYMPGALLPKRSDGGSWFDAEELKFVRLSSKSHWDVPVKLPGGTVLHLLCSHPTPPVFDGDEKRNARRNHDEIRFWADYLDGAAYIVDDSNRPGGMAPGSLFVILGDLNADPDEGESFKNPVGKFLLGGGKINTSITPTSDVSLPGLDPDDTAMFKLRVDYVLPSRELGIARAGVWREALDGGAFPSDHFPVWAEVTVPAPGGSAGR